MSSVISSAAPRRLHQLLGLASTSHNITSSWSSWKLTDCFFPHNNIILNINIPTCSINERHYLWATLKKGWQTVIYLKKILHHFEFFEVIYPSQRHCFTHFVEADHDFIIDWYYNNYLWISVFFFFICLNEFVLPLFVHYEFLNTLVEQLIIQEIVEVKKNHFHPKR